MSEFRTKNAIFKYLCENNVLNKKNQIFYNYIHSLDWKLKHKQIVGRTNKIRINNSTILYLTLVSRRVARFL